MTSVIFGAGTLLAASDQTINFPAVADTVSGAVPFALSATASSGLPVSYSVVSGPVTISSNIISIMAAGTAVIQASQAGNDSFSPATNVVQSFEINRFQWTTNSGGNGHYYEVRYPGPAGINWTNAQNDAVSAGGYLATITSAAEDEFVFNLINANTNLWVFSSDNKFGPLTGGYKVVDDGVTNWAWVTGEPFTYQNWGPSRPNSSSAVDHVQYFTRDPDATNDALVDAWSDLPNNGRSLGYIIEYDTSPDSRLNQSINFPAIPDQTYGVAPIALNATASSGLPVEYTIVYGLASISNNFLIVNGTGGVTVCASVAGNANYYSRSNVNQEFYVNREGLWITPANLAGPYGDTNRIFSGNVVGLVSADGIIVGYSTTATAGSAPGTYPITPVLTDPNNRLTNYVVIANPATLIVTQALLTVTATSTSRGYGAANPPWTGTLVGAWSGDNLSATYNSSATAASPVGTYPIIAGVSDPGNRLGNYVVVINNGVLSVTPAPLTVTANNVTRLYGAANPVFTGVISGVQNGDNITASYSCAAVASSPVGTFPIIPQLTDPGSKLANYSVSSVDGTLTVGSPAAPVLLRPTRPSGNSEAITLAWSASSGFGYQVQYTTSLKSAEWTNLGPIVTATDSTASIIDTPPAGAPRFYRVVLQLP